MSHILQCLFMAYMLTGVSLQLYGWWSGKTDAWQGLKVAYLWLPLVVLGFVKGK